ncbi:MAG TPA: cutinase family protein, partial [Nocardioides sp.]|uniref:cutinase family protein n=1 Tax=Nocardioides sp. TaxID=35761 RepID=UPI002CE6EDF9
MPEPGFSRRATALAAVAALAVTLAVVAVVAVVVDHPGRPTPRATPVQSAQECADVLVLGASGSGERSTGQADLGPTLEAFRRAYAVAGRGSGRTVEALYVGRETAAPRQLRDPVSPRGSVIRSSSRSSVRAWEGDLAGDTTRILDALTAARSLCPDQQIVLAGYSQGAMAVHATLTRLAARPQVFGRVVAAVLVADGHRVAGTQARL